MKKNLFVLFGILLFVAGCVGPQKFDFSKFASGDKNVLENTFIFDEGFDGMGTMDWRYYSSISSDSPLYRQLDNPFLFAYPRAWDLEEDLQGVHLIMDGFSVDFLPGFKKESRSPYQTALSYCPTVSNGNGSDFVLVSQGSITVAGKESAYVKHGSTAEDGDSGYTVCLDLGDEFMVIDASPLNEDSFAMFENILGSLTIGLGAEDTPIVWSIKTADEPGVTFFVDGELYFLPAEDFVDVNLELIPDYSGDVGTAVPDMVSFNEYVKLRAECASDSEYCRYYGIGTSEEFFNVYYSEGVGISRMEQKRHGI